MFSSIQSIPGLIFARSDVKAKIRPGVEARCLPNPPTFAYREQWECITCDGDPIT